LFSFIIQTTAQAAALTNVQPDQWLYNHWWGLECCLCFYSFINIPYSSPV